MKTTDKIIKYYRKNTLTKKKAIDIFADSVENYKKANKKERLYWVAKSFIDAFLVMKCDFLTGAQALEVANNLATDFGADKDIINRKIVYIVSKKGKK